LEYYVGEELSTPNLFINGVVEERAGGSLSEAKDRYDAFRKIIETALEKPAQAGIQASAVRKGDKIEISAQVSALENPGENLRLRFVLMEETARYVGSNGVRFHHHIVRGMPAGEQGLALKEKTTRHSASIDVGQLRNQLTKYVSAVSKKSGTRFPDAEQLVQLKDLHLVAFVQNDKTKEVLQAKLVDVQGGKE
jgi:hypothetical protein